MGKIAIADKLYGRDQEIESLKQIFSEVCRGEGRMVLIPGHSGTGKTSLVYTLRQSILERNGWYAHGKFNQYQRGLPYFGFRQALSQLWSEIERMSDAARNAILTQIRDQIGDLAYLLTDLIPAIEKHIGLQENPDGISPQEARHRFTRVMQTFLQIICRPEHPVKIFIDDWQWADHASLDLLRQLVVGGELRFLILVISYRDDEVGHDHPLQPVLSDLKRLGRPLSVLTVRNLDPNSIRDFITGNLTPRVDDLEGLSELVYSVTKGNPFYARAFLEYLSEFDFLRFDGNMQAWSFRVNKSAIPENIIDLFARRLGQFKDETRRVLAMAACLGSVFDLDTLHLSAQLTADEIKPALEAPLATGMVVRMKASLDAQSDERVQQYQFFHDRVQEAAFQLIPAKEISEVRFDIGCRMLANLDEARKESLLFEITDHLNHGTDLIRTEEERIAVIRLNVSAAEKARMATAYSAVLVYFRKAASLARQLPDGMARLAEAHHDLAMQILQGLGESEFLEGDSDAGEEAIQQAVALAVGPVERAGLQNVLIVNYTLQARYKDAIATGRNALHDLGIELPEDCFEEARDREMAEVKKAIGSRSILSLVDSPLMTDPAMKAATTLLITMGPPCYRTHQRLWSVMVPLVVRITIEHGLVPQVGYSHTAFGGLLGWVEDNYRDAKDFGEVAIRVMRDRFDTPSYQSIFYLMVGSSTRHWFHHLRESTADYQKAYEIGLRSGNLQYAAYGFGHDMYCSFFQGKSLERLITQSQQSLLFSRSRMNVWAIDLLEGGLLLFELLRNKASTPGAFSQDQAYQTQIDEHHNVQVQCIYQIIKAQCLLVMGESSKALALVEATQGLVYTVGTQGLLPWPEYVFTRCLLLAAAYTDANAEVQGEMRQEMKATLAKLKTWEAYAADNYRHKHLLAAAEYEALFSPSWEVLLRYDEAISEALRGGFVHWAAYANERAWRFLSNAGHGALAHAYRLESYRCYAEWGAAAKCSQMESEPGEQFVGGEQDVLGDIPPETHKAICQKSVSTLQLYSRIHQSARQEKEQADVFNELAQATERLRVEVLEHKRTEDLLRDSQRLLVATQAIGKIGGWALYLDHMELRWTKETFAIHALETEQEPSVEQAISYYMPDSQPIIRKAVKSLIADGSPFNLELQIRTEMGDIRNVRVIGEMAPEGNVVSGVIQDVTEHVLLEQQLQQSDKMRAVGQLAGGIAHDFNNQLSAVLGYADMLNRHINDPLLKRYCENVLVGARRSADLTKQLLAFSRKGQYTYRTVHVHKLLGEVISILSHSVDKRISFKQLLEAHPDTVMGDESQIQNAVLNLALNARDAMANGGVITFRTEARDASSPCSRWQGTQSKDGYLRLDVEDTGVGMDEETQRHVFEPFFTTKEVGKGTGMGLAAAYGTVQNHGGCICVKSRLGQGSKFSICMPMCGVTEESKKSSSGIHQPANHLRVMIVDDEEIVCDMAKDYLEFGGHRPVVFQDGSEALTYYREYWPEIDLIILDMVMPGLCGMEVFKKLREVNPEALVILASGYSIEGEAREIMDLGAHYFLQKPFDKDDLDKALHAGTVVLPKD